MFYTREKAFYIAGAVVASREGQELVTAPRAPAGYKDEDKIAAYLREAHAQRQYLLPWLPVSGTLAVLVVLDADGTTVLNERYEGDGTSGGLPDRSQAARTLALFLGALYPPEWKSVYPQEMAPLLVGYRVDRLVQIAAMEVAHLRSLGEALPPIPAYLWANGGPPEENPFLCEPHIASVRGEQRKHLEPEAVASWLGCVYDGADLVAQARCAREMCLRLGLTRLPSRGVEWPVRPFLPAAAPPVLPPVPPPLPG